MSHFAYILALAIGIAGLAVIDRRFKLAWWRDAKRTTKTIAPAVGMFIVWDAAGIADGIFFHGASPYSLPFTILPEFPPEELLFLCLLCYSALVLYAGAKRVWPRT